MIYKVRAKIIEEKLGDFYENLRMEQSTANVRMVKKWFLP